MNIIHKLIRQVPGKAPKKRAQSSAEHACGIIDLCIYGSNIEKHNANKMQRNDDAPDLGPLYYIKYYSQFDKDDSDDCDTFHQSCYI